MTVKSVQELEAIRQQCRALVTRRAMVSGGAAALPVPGMDIGVDVAILVKLLPEISRQFGLTAEQIQTLDPAMKQRVLVLAGTVGSELIGKFITKQLIVQILKRVGIRVSVKSVTKFMPIVGSALSASISFTAMRMLGNGHVNDCYEVAKRLLLERER